MFLNNFFLDFFLFCYGSIFGSFLNSLIYRLKAIEITTKKEFFFSRSHCPFCLKTIRWYDLIPVLSFFLLKGKCRFCQKKISWQYPLVEIFSGLLLVFIFKNFCPSFSWFNILNCFYYFIVLSAFLVLFVYDLKYLLIPSQIVYGTIFLVFIYQLFNFFWSENLTIFKNHLFSGILGALFFLALYLFSRGKWLGFGDVEMAFLIGFFLGFPKILVSFLVAFFLGGIIGVILILLKKKNFKSEIAFGPFLSFGVLVALFWGEKIVNWYLNFFF